MLEKIKEIIADQLDLNVNVTIELDVDEINADMTVAELASAVEKKVQP